MRIGAHVRQAKGILSAVDLATRIGCETTQVFAANPNAWKPSAINPDTAAEFRCLIEEANIKPVVIHTQYLINLASPDDSNFAKSTLALNDAMHRADMLGAKFVVTHIGSHRGAGRESGLERICEAVVQALEEESDAVLLLENSSGAGDTIGSRFEDIRTILDRLEGYYSKLGVCLDTAHMWGAGYDLSDAAAIESTFAEYSSVVGIDRLKLLHLNDTNVELGSYRDRHANIGLGRIGEKGFSTILCHPELQDIPGVVETPPRSPESTEHDVHILKRLRDACT